MLKEIKLQVAQQLNKRDKEARVALCTAMSGLLRGKPRHPELFANDRRSPFSSFGLRKQTEHAILVTSEP